MDLDALLDNGDEVAKLMRPLYVLLLTQAAEDAEAALGVDDLFSLDNPRVQETLSDLATLVRKVAETTKDDIRRLVGQAAEAGWSPDELADKIAELGEISSRSRAMLISRTETAHAYTRGAVLAYEASGVVAGTEWLLGGDPCPECQPYGGKVATLGEMFDGGVMVPLHPACTCALAPVLKER